MTNDAFKDIEELESDLWEAAESLRAISKLTSWDYFMLGSCDAASGEHSGGTQN